MDSDDEFNSGPDKIVFRVRPPSTGNSVLDLLARVNSVSLNQTERDKTNQISKSNQRPSDESSLIVTSANVLTLFSEDEKRKIFKTSSNSSIAKYIRNMPLIRLKEDEEGDFKDYIDTFGVEGFWSWSETARFKSFIDHADARDRVPLPDREGGENNQRLLQFVKETGGYAVRACKENAESKFAFCTWIIFNELNERVPNVGWGPPPSVPDDPPYRIVDVPIKGKAVIATRTIEEGETIFKERPLVIQPPLLPLNRDNFAEFYEEALEVLSPEDRDAFYSLADTGKPVTHGPKPFRICETNNVQIYFPRSKKSPHYAGVFRTFSRCNHSCSPNATHDFSAKDLVLEMRAKRTIQTGEEITVTYGDLDKVYSARQEEFKRRYLFDCRCEMCSLEPEERKRSDERRKRIATMTTSMSMRLWQNAMLQNTPSNNRITGPSGTNGQSSAVTRAEKGKAVAGIDDSRVDLGYWVPDQFDASRKGVERIIKMHTDILHACEAEKLDGDRFDHARWLARAYATLGDKKNTKYWVMEGRKAMKFTIDYKGAFRDADEDIVNAWDTVVEDVTRHPEWNYFSNRTKYFKRHGEIGA